MAARMAQLRRDATQMRLLPAMLQEHAAVAPTHASVNPYDAAIALEGSLIAAAAAGAQLDGLLRIAHECVRQHGVLLVRATRAIANLARLDVSAEAAVSLALSRVARPPSPAALMQCVASGMHLDVLECAELMARRRERAARRIAEWLPRPHSVHAHVADVQLSRLLDSLRRASEDTRAAERTLISISWRHLLVNFGDAAALDHVIVPVYFNPCEAQPPLPPQLAPLWEACSAAAFEAGVRVVSVIHATRESPRSDAPVLPPWPAWRQHSPPTQDDADTSSSGSEGGAGY